MITIECARCETSTDLPPGSMLVEVGDEADQDVGGRLSWICDQCREVVTLPVTWSVLLLVVAAGALLFEEQEDDRPPHPEAPPAAAPLTSDDLLDLHRALDEPTWFSRLEAAVESQQRGGAR